MIIILLHSSDRTDQHLMSISEAKGPDDYHKRSWRVVMLSLRLVLRWLCFLYVEQAREDNQTYSNVLQS